MLDKAIIIVNYRTYANTLTCFKSIFNLCDFEDYVIFLVDNSDVKTSRPEFIAETRKIFSNSDVSVISIHNGPRSISSKINLIIDVENKGFSHACNIGVKFVENYFNTIKKIWFLNNDCIVSPDAGHWLSEELNKSPKDVCGSLLLNTDGTVQSYGGGKYNKVLGLHKKQVPDDDLDYVSAASCMINLDLLQEIGLLSEDYFLYFEEWDLALKLRRLGGSLKYCGKSCVYHIGSGTIGVGDKQIYYSTRSSIIFYKKYYRVFLPLIISKKIVLSIRYLFSNPKRSLAYFYGVCDGFNRKLRLNVF